jgi:hypothetical protein
MFIPPSVVRQYLGKNVPAATNRCKIVGRMIFGVIRVLLKRRVCVDISKGVPAATKNYWRSREVHVVSTE